MKYTRLSLPSFSFSISLLFFLRWLGSFLLIPGAKMAKLKHVAFELSIYKAGDILYSRGIIILYISTLHSDIPTSW